MGTLNASQYGIVMGVLISASMALNSPMALAQGPQGAQGSGNKQEKTDKVDISDLENKYWAPKDTDFSVVQNRTYTKERRIFLTGHFGRPINDPWSVGNVGGASLNYFFSERFGLQATYLKAGLNNNKASDYIASNFGSGIFPDHNRLKSYMGLGFSVVPFYAKMSFMGKKILYFDMAFTPTLGVTSYDQQIQTGERTKSAFTYGLDITQYFFFTNYFAIRLDLKNHWYTEEIARYYQSSGIATGDKVKDQTAQDTLFLLGLTFFY